MLEEDNGLDKMDMKHTREQLIERYRNGEQLEFLLFYGHKEIPGCVDEACLSQWYPCTFQVDGVNFYTTEQYMMAQKALLFGDEETCGRIMAAKGPHDFKKLGRKVRGFQEGVWDANKYEIVLRANTAKFSQNKVLQEFLLSTGNAVIVECNPRDTVWGIAMRKEDPAALDPENWRGENLLGFVLMEVRDVIRAQTGDRAQCRAGDAIGEEVFARPRAESTSRKEQKIVVLGGSFNPPTLAHLRLLTGAMDSMNADRGIFVPSSKNYVKRKMKRAGHPQEVLPEKTRAQMLADMCETDARLEIEECEFRDDGRGHTFDTMAKIQKKHPHAVLYFLIGADKLGIIPRWRSREQFFEQFEFVVVTRDGDEPEKVIRQNPVLFASKDIFHIIPEPEGVAGISSTIVRDSVRRGDESAKEMVTPGVWKRLVDAGWLGAKERTPIEGTTDTNSSFAGSGDVLKTE